MSWSGAWLGRWLGEWLGSSDDDGAVYGGSASALAGTTGEALGALYTSGSSAVALGDASGTAGAIAVAPPRPFVGTAGWLVGRRPLQAIAGRSAGTLDDVTGAAAGGISAFTPRQLRGRRDDMDLLVSGWR